MSMDSNQVGGGYLLWQLRCVSRSKDLIELGDIGALWPELVAGAAARICNFEALQHAVVALAGLNS